MTHELEEEACDFEIVHQLFMFTIAFEPHPVIWYVEYAVDQEEQGCHIEETILALIFADH